MNTHLIITKPFADEYPEWFAGEIELVHYNDLIGGLDESFKLTLPFLEKLTHDDLAYAMHPENGASNNVAAHY